MKKLSLFAAMGLLVMSLAACGRGNENAETNESTQSTETQQTTEQQSTESQETQESADNGGQSTGSGEYMDISNGWSDEMTAVRTAIVDALGENYWPSMILEPELLEGNFGLTADMYDDYLAEMPMISTNVDTLLIIHAKDGKVEDVEAALNAYRENLINDTMQYPQNLSKIQASRIETIGSYVCFVQLGGDAIEAEDEEAAIEKCLEQNELVVELIRQNVES